MAITRPTGEQLRFLSQNTGEHVLDTYLESAEKGSRSLPDLLDDLFDGSGVFRAANFEFRFDATTDKIQFRAGNFSNGSTGWTDITTFFNITGAFNSSTNYNNFDVLTLTNKDVYIVHGLSSAVTFSDEAAVIASSNTDKLVDVSEARDWAKKTDGIVDTTDYSSKAWAIGGTGVTDTASKGAAKEWATKTGGTVDGSDYSAKHWATTGTVVTVSSGISNINTVAAAISNVNTTATNISNVNTVGGISANVTTVAGISANVTTVAANNANVTTVATNNSNINSLATNMTDINTVADEIDNNKLQTVANNINAVITAADDLNESTSEIDTVATNIANVNTVGGISSNVTTVAGISANVTTVAGISANTTTVAGIAANVTTVAGIAADVTTAATNVTAFNNTYLGGLSSDPTQDPDGSALDAGDLYFDTTNSVMKVYDGSQWGNASSSISGIRDMFVYTATAGQTAFSGTDINSKSMTIDKALLVSVFMNGIKLVEGSSRDYTVDVSGNTITLTSSAAVNDQIEVEVFGNFAAQSPTDVNIGGGTIASTTINSATVSSGNLSFDDNQKAIFGAGSDLSIFHNGINSLIADSGTGGLIIRSNLLSLQNAAGTETLASFVEDGAVTIRYDNATKLATTSTGIDVTGTVTADGLTVDNGSSGQSKITISEGGVNNRNLVLYSPALGGTSSKIAVEGTTADLDFVVNNGAQTAIRIGGSTGDISFYDTSGNAKFFWSATDESLGIGTSSPFDALHVEGTIRGNVSSASDENIRLTTTGGGGFVIDVDDATVANPTWSIRTFASEPLAFDIGGTERMRITSSGSIGIGTSSPAADLHVNSGASNLAGLFESTDAGATISLIDNGTTGGSAAEHGLNTVGDKLEIRAVDNLSFETNAAERMRLDSTGKLSLGTDLTNADSSLLHITSGSTDNFAMLQLENTNTGSSTAPDIAFYRNSASPADDDNIGALHFYGNNSADERILYGIILNQIIDVTDGTEDSKFSMNLMKDGSLKELFSVGSAEVVINEESVDVNFRVESNNDAAAFFVDGADGNIGMSTSVPSTHIPVSNNSGKRSFVNFFTGGTQFVAGRSDTTVNIGDYIGGYLLKTIDGSGNKFGGMIATADDATGNGNLEFYPVSNAYENGSEGSMQLDDSGDIYLRAGGIRCGRSHNNIYTSTEESIVIYHAGSGSNNTSTQITSRDGTGADAVFRHFRRGTIKSEIEEDGSFHSAVGSYGGTSDQRLKENIVASGSQWDDIKALQVKKYSMIEDELDAPNMLGVIAQDLQASGMNGLVSQHFKTDTDDNPILDADGNQEEYLSVKYSVLYMKAIKALQEAMAKIEVLETKVAALEAE